MTTGDLPSRWSIDSGPGNAARPRSWLEDFPRRARLEAAASAAYPGLRYRRRQRASGPVDIYQYVQAVPGY